MKASEAFYSSFEYVTELTSYIFSLGHRRIFANDNFLIIGLFVLGQLAKYVIGFPLGLVVGVLAAGIVALINLFKPDRQPEINVQKDDEVRVEIAVEPVVDTKEDLQPVIEVQPEPVLLDKTAEKLVEIERKSFAEKKEKFISCDSS